MTPRPTDDLIDKLAADAAPVRPLASPARRALATLILLALPSAAAFVLFSATNPLAMRGPGGERQAALELLAMLTTGALALLGAFHLAIPGRSRRWLAAPVLPLIAWLMLSGLGCYRDLVRDGPSGWQVGHSADCFFFILGASLLLGVPLAWRLSRASPINPLPVAALGGLASAALSAVLLSFFHPFAVTFIDLAMHSLAIVAVIAVASLLRRRMLRAA